MSALKVPDGFFHRNCGTIPVLVSRRRSALEPMWFLTMIFPSIVVLAIGMFALFAPSAVERLFDTYRLGMVLTVAGFLGVFFGARAGWMR
jgi:hypothetical protein